MRSNFRNIWFEIGPLVCDWELRSNLGKRHPKTSHLEWSPQGSLTPMALGRMCLWPCVITPRGVYLPPNRRQSMVFRGLFQQTNKCAEVHFYQKSKDRRGKGKTHTQVRRSDSVSQQRWNDWDKLEQRWSQTRKRKLEEGLQYIVSLWVMIKDYIVS